MNKNNVVVNIDEGSGFCFGVVKAISTAEKELANTETLYCLGDIVHNGQEVERLSALGLKTIDHEQMSKLSGVKVLLRAHGEPPATYLMAKENNITIVDASCPVVLLLQKKIRLAYETDPSAQIVIYGKNGHAEVLGLVGQTNGKAIVVENIDDLAKINFKKSIILFSQTTKSVEGFNALVNEIKTRIDHSVSFIFNDTICRQVANRIPNIKDFARKYDVVLFVSGVKSSNGKVLFAQCKQVNENTHMIVSVEDIKKEWFDSAVSIGVCGATSTPKWLMEFVANGVKRMLAE